MLGASLFTSLPPLWLILTAAALAIAGLFSGGLRLPALALLACCWALSCFYFRIQDQLDPVLANQVLTVRGHVSSIPSQRADSVRFRFVTDPASSTDGLPETLLVSWYRDWPELRVGQYWQLELRVKPPWGGVNFQGSDKERWLFAQGIGGQGTVREGRMIAPASGGRYRVNSLRERVLQSIAERVSDERSRGVIQALATADRSGLASPDMALLAATGTSHLLAISGLHVGLAATGGMWLSRLLFLFLPLSRMGGATYLIMVAGGLLSALCYAALAGFGIPTLRSVLMLSVVLSAVVLHRAIHPARALVSSLAVILLIDPFAPLGAGMWFSFIAVAALLWVFLPRTGNLKWWQTLLMAQTGVILVLFPVGAAWFNTFSPSGFAANLLAIPWVSILVVPLVLAGLLALPLSGALAGLLWSIAGWASSVLFEVLEWIGGLQGQLPVLAPPGVLQAVLALAGAAILLLPRGVPVRWLGCFLVAPLLFPPGQRVPPGVVSMEVLDVGQGTAVLVSSGAYSLLYDSGPGDGKDIDLVRGVIVPALAMEGPDAPVQVIISHGDLDHAGGLQSLLTLYPEAEYRANLGHGRILLDSCHTPQRWNWPGVAFRTLHPSAHLPYLANDSSCVISVQGAGGRLLLSGDISEAVENRLVTEGVEPHTLLLVPHHGSRSSSSQAFIGQLNPEAAVATASLGNRFGFPRPEIRARYEAQEARFWSTGECGALRIVLERDGSLRAGSARRMRNRIWRWPAGSNCP